MTLLSVTHVGRNKDIEDFLAKNQEAKKHINQLDEICDQMVKANIDFNQAEMLRNEVSKFMTYEERNKIFDPRNSSRIVLKLCHAEVIIDVDEPSIYCDSSSKGKKKGLSTSASVILHFDEFDITSNDFGFEEDDDDDAEIIFGNFPNHNSFLLYITNQELKHVEKTCKRSWNQLINKFKVHQAPFPDPNDKFPDLY